jgi:hypothetical protein
VRKSPSTVACGLYEISRSLASYGLTFDGVGVGGVFGDRDAAMRAAFHHAMSL